MVEIMLDAGHDINTAGKRALDGSMREFEFNRVVVEKLKFFLEQYEGVTVLLSHDLYDKVDTGLDDRVGYANREQSNCYISVHANAGVATARGIETFIHPRAGQNTRELGLRIHNHLIIMTSQKNRGLKEADFHVLRETKMDAVLVECGFMTNEADLALLKSDSYREKCALGILNGLIETYGLKKKKVDQPKLIVAGKQIYRVVTGSFADRENAEKRIKELKEKGFDSFLDIYTK